MKETWLVISSDSYIPNDILLLCYSRITSIFLFHMGFLFHMHPRVQSSQVFFLFNKPCTLTKSQNQIVTQYSNIFSVLLEFRVIFLFLEDKNEWCFSRLIIISVTKFVFGFGHLAEWFYTSSLAYCCVVDACSKIILQK